MVLVFDVEASKLELIKEAGRLMQEADVGVKVISDNQWELESTSFCPKTEEQLATIFKAEDKLEAAGVVFDTGSWVAGEGIPSRNWSLDWSLNGAHVEG